VTATDFYRVQKKFLKDIFIYTENSLDKDMNRGVNTPDIKKKDRWRWDTSGHGAVMYRAFLVDLF
jgi:hypothetical protein